MPIMTAEQKASRGAWAIRRLAIVGGAVALLALLVAIAVSPVPMRGAELFGALANKIKGNPGATAYLTLAAGALLWVGIGLLAAIQEWRATWRKTQ